MKLFRLLSTCCVITFCLACTKSHVSAGDSQASATELNVVKDGSEHDQKSQAKKILFSKELKESLYFAASLERESLRLISRQSDFAANTLFSVLSFAFEIESGVKKTGIRNVDCSRFRIEKIAAEQLNLFKTCQKPETLIAKITSNVDQSEVRVHFFLKEWSSVVGLSVTLTNSDIECLLKIKDKKLSEMICENWAYFLEKNDSSATEVRLKTMNFRRDQPLQLKLAGGFFKDLVERKKIEISVPLEGKIKLIEKEIEVKDDFADQIKTSEEARGQKESELKENEQEKKQSSQQEEQKEQQKDYQKHIQVENQSQQNGESKSESKAGPESNPNQNPQENLEVIEGESSGGVPQQPIHKNRGR